MTLSDITATQSAESVQFNNYDTAYDVVIPLIFLKNNKRYRKILFDVLFDGDNSEAVTKIQRVLEEYKQKCFDYLTETQKVKDKLYRYVFSNPHLTNTARNKQDKQIEKELKQAENLLKKATQIQKEFEAYL